MWLRFQSYSIYNYISITLAVMFIPVNACASGTTHCPVRYLRYSLSFSLLYDGPISEMADLIADNNNHWALDPGTSASRGYYLECHYGKKTTSFRLPRSDTRCDDTGRFGVLCR